MRNPSVLDVLLSEEIPFAVLCSNIYLKHTEVVVGHDWFVIVTDDTNEKILKQYDFKKSDSKKYLFERTMKGKDFSVFDAFLKTGEINPVDVKVPGRVYHPKRINFQKHYTNHRNRLDEIREDEMRKKPKRKAA